VKQIDGFKWHAVTCIVTAVVAFGFLGVFLSLGGALPSLGKHYEVSAVIPKSGTVVKGTRVTMAGVKVGTVRTVERRGYGALVRIRFDNDRATPLPVDSRFALRARTAVGENYLEVDRGKSNRMLPSGAVAAITQADDAVDVDQILSTLQGQTRGAARQAMRATGRALDGRGRQLNDLVGAAADFFDGGPRVVDVLADNRRSLRSVVLNLGSLADDIGQREQAIRTVAGQGLVTFRSIASRDDAVRRLLPQLAPTLDQVRRTTKTLSLTTSRATGVVSQLGVAMRQVRPAVRRLQPAAARGHAAVNELGRAAPRLRRTVDRLRTASKPLGRALPKIRSVFCQANPALSYLKPYTDDVIQTVVGLASASNAYDGIGHTIRVGLTISDNSLVGLPDDVNKAVFSLLHTGLLSKVNQLTYEPYPKPGNVSKPSSWGDDIFGPKDVARAGYTFPRIHPSC
jgi:phospholipid/cholesterol/gamma-HCH transport system substrate-binding protein